MTDDELKAIEELAGRATPGPWVVAGPWPRVTICVYTDGGDPDVGMPGMEPLFQATDGVKSGQSCDDHADASYAVAAANALPALIARLEAAEAERERLVALLESIPPRYVATGQLSRYGVSYGWFVWDCQKQESVPFKKYTDQAEAEALAARLNAEDRPIHPLTEGAQG